jgi:hypothetical protein
MALFQPVSLVVAEAISPTSAGASPADWISQVS